ncbi:DUF3179 domain-containing protein [Aliifodinibius sp. S!AR15-10]|uniref:DUF3179 domain-containing protein n=1 Tax=Aliifodinibius sp. S!AR15-10 TaxID=2950437 RepID=UPI00286FD880|nr:DUF3179 domain-containing protein [Aliifodinibius sp. S!AR15-10]
MVSFKYLAIIIFSLSFFASCGRVTAQNLQQWNTNTEKTLIDLSELQYGGPGKDGIPSIDNPEFVSNSQAGKWLSDKEPVISLVSGGEARAYPLQILIWHEIVNDRISGEPVLVTFCPLCYSAIVFERTVDGEVLEFGVSGLLRNADLVMYDRKTETFWQQFTGRAIVGDYVPSRLKQIPSQIISFKQFRDSYPDGKVLYRETGFDKNYGSNPYAGYDDVDNPPAFLEGVETGKLPPMEKVIGVKMGKKTKGYPYSITKEEKVINDNFGNTQIVVFHMDGALSALDETAIAESREDGSTGVFKRKIEGQTLTFELRSNNIYDIQTQSQWNITGKAVDGPLKGTQLKTVTYGDYFAFAWLVFWPKTEIYKHK